MNTEAFRHVKDVIESGGSIDEKYEDLCEEYTRLEEMEDPRNLDKARIEDAISVLVKLRYGCLVCGDPECQRGVAYVGDDAIHASDHPDVQREKQMTEYMGKR